MFRRDGIVVENQITSVAPHYDDVAIQLDLPFHVAFAV